MAVFYTKREIHQALAALRIWPKCDGVTGAEAARILTWRAKAECGIDHEYSLSSVRRHVSLGNLVPRPQSTRFNRYGVEDIFLLPIAPRRGLDCRAA